MKSQNTVIF